MISLPYNFEELTYAGVLGKIIGVYIGRPIENWTNEKIESKFGQINRYVHACVDQPLIVADDDITGTFMFAHSLADHDFRDDFSAKHIGQTWLDILIENKTIFWWGGYGQATEHTAWLNLKSGIEAPMSGSASINGEMIANQIGAQIFIDGWGMLNPGKPAQAAKLAREAALVSHDQESVNAAIIIAVLISQAYVEQDINKLLDCALSFIDEESQIAHLINEVREWHAEDPNDWKGAFKQLKDRHGYHHYDGICHIMPNHGLIILSLLYAGNSFHQSMVIVNTLGWDTDCNAANVGCINGIRLGLEAINEGYDWRTPVGDRILLPTGHSRQVISDAVQETDKLINMIHRMHGDANLIEPKKPKFNFSFLGSTQGFMPVLTNTTSPNTLLSNNDGRLCIDFKHVIEGVPASIHTATHIQKNHDVQAGYQTIGCPSLYSGQIVTANMMSQNVSGDSRVRVFIETYDYETQSDYFYSDMIQLSDSQEQKISWKIPDIGNKMIANIGVEISTLSSVASNGRLYLNNLHWEGSPTMTISYEPKPRSVHNQYSWISNMDYIDNFVIGDTLRVSNNTGHGIMVHGSEDWDNYKVTMPLLSNIKSNFGVIVRYRGLTRYYSIELTKDNKLQIVRHHFDTTTIIAQAPFNWRANTSYLFAISVNNNHFVCHIDNKLVLEIDDKSMPNTMKIGAAGLSLSIGTVHFKHMNINKI